MAKEEGDPLQDVKDDVHDLLEGKSFGSVEEVQAFFDQYSQQQNTASMDDFHGLSPEQMHRFLYMPFDSPELVTFQRVLPTEPQSQAAFLLTMLIEEIEEEGIKVWPISNRFLQIQ